MHSEELEAVRERADLAARVRFLESENDELKSRIEEMYAMVNSMNETIITLNYTIEKVATPLNSDIIELKKFAKEFNHTKYKVLGGMVVIIILVGSLWSVVSPVISKFLSKTVG